MFWPMFQLTLAFLGVAVLGVLGVRVGVEARRFARAVAASSERIGAAAETLERSAAPLVARGGAVHRTFGRASGRDGDGE
ncbi:hypothetical protein [Streptomyces avicenniae]|uniref:hypothetical protein n=1 Tax=Streptomyces avicenniae TaxID=500153 RepID=UPI00069BCDB1|nr:hypothetical protein [Streptomyces avicenniae]